MAGAAAAAAGAAGAMGGGWASLLGGAASTVASFAGSATATAALNTVAHVQELAGYGDPNAWIGQGTKEFLKLIAPGFGHGVIGLAAMIQRLLRDRSKDNTQLRITEMQANVLQQRLQFEREAVQAYQRQLTGNPFQQLPDLSAGIPSNPNGYVSIYQAAPLALPGPVPVAPGSINRQAIAYAPQPQPLQPPQPAMQQAPPLSPEFLRHLLGQEREDRNSYLGQLRQAREGVLIHLQSALENVDVINYMADRKDRADEVRRAVQFFQQPVDDVLQAPVVAEAANERQASVILANQARAVQHQVAQYQAMVGQIQLFVADARLHQRRKELKQSPPAAAIETEQQQQPEDRRFVLVPSPEVKDEKSVITSAIVPPTPLSLVPIENNASQSDTVMQLVRPSALESGVNKDAIDEVKMLADKPEVKSDIEQALTKWSEGKTHIASMDALSVLTDIIAQNAIFWLVDIDDQTQLALLSMLMKWRADSVHLEKLYYGQGVNSSVTWCSDVHASLSVAKPPTTLSASFDSVVRVRTRSSLSERFVNLGFGVHIQKKPNEAYYTLYAGQFGTNGERAKTTGSLGVYFTAKDTTGVAFFNRFRKDANVELWCCTPKTDSNDDKENIKKCRYGRINGEYNPTVCRMSFDMEHLEDKEQKTRLLFSYSGFVATDDEDDTTDVPYGFGTAILYWCPTNVQLSDTGAPQIMDREKLIASNLLCKVTGWWRNGIPCGWSCRIERFRLLDKLTPLFNITIAEVNREGLFEGFGMLKTSEFVACGIFRNNMLTGLTNVDFLTEDKSATSSMPVTRFVGGWPVAYLLRKWFSSGASKDNETESIERFCQVWELVSNKNNSHGCYLRTIQNADFKTLLYNSLVRTTLVIGDTYEKQSNTIVRATGVQKAADTAVAVLSPVTTFITGLMFEAPAKSERQIKEQQRMQIEQREALVITFLYAACYLHIPLCTTIWKMMQKRGGFAAEMRIIQDVLSTQLGQLPKHAIFQMMERCGVVMGDVAASLYRLLLIFLDDEHRRADVDPMCTLASVRMQQLHTVALPPKADNWHPFSTTVEAQKVENEEFVFTFYYRTNFAPDDAYIHRSVCVMRSAVVQTALQSCVNSMANTGGIVNIFTDKCMLPNDYPSITPPILQTLSYPALSSTAQTAVVLASGCVEHLYSTSSSVNANVVKQVVASTPPSMQKPLWAYTRLYVEKRLADMRPVSLKPQDHVFVTWPPVAPNGQFGWYDVAPVARVCEYHKHKQQKSLAGQVLLLGGASIAQQTKAVTDKLFCDYFESWWTSYPDQFGDKKTDTKQQQTQTREQQQPDQQVEAIRKRFTNSVTITGADSDTEVDSDTEAESDDDTEHLSGALAAPGRQQELRRRVNVSKRR
jgi:hypothetical protein